MDSSPQPEPIPSETPFNEAIIVDLKMGHVLDELLDSVSALTITKLGRPVSNSRNNWRGLSAMLAFEVRSCRSYPANEILQRDFWKWHKTKMPAHYQLQRVLRALGTDMDFWTRLLDYRADRQFRSGYYARNEVEAVSAVVERGVPSEELESLLEAFVGLHLIGSLHYATLEVTLTVLKSIREAYGGPIPIRQVSKFIGRAGNQARESGRLGPDHRPEEASFRMC